MALAHADFIGAKHCDAVQRPLCLNLRQGLLVDVLDRLPMQVRRTSPLP